MAVVKGLERIPLIGIAGGFVEGYIPLVDDYFYCESSYLQVSSALTVRYVRIKEGLLICT
jgi:hypothetical protein